MKIYTRTGDKGETSLFSGQRVSKNHLRVETYGTVDEMNSVLGAACASKPHAETASHLAKLQNFCFQLGADLATPLDSPQKLVRVTGADVAWLEREMDDMDKDLSPLKNFILPGGTPAAAHIHIARSVCRRAERLAVALAVEETINPESVVYLNRLSDFLFTLARLENLRQGVPDTIWISSAVG